MSSSSTTTSSSPPQTIAASPITPTGRRYLNLYHSQKNCDCSFQIDDIIINCHKLILSSASPVFDAMFYGPMSSSSSSSSSTIITSPTSSSSLTDDKDNIDNEKYIKIIDINPDTFQILIEYIYCGEIDYRKLDIEQLIELYYSSEKYIINDLIYDCLKELKKKLEYKNILQALDLSVYMGLQPIIKILLQYIDKYCLQNGNYQFMNTLDTIYYHISRDTLKLIIDNIKNNGNLTSIWFIKYWCKKECKKLCLNDNDYYKLLKDFNLDDINNEQQQQQQQLNLNLNNINNNKQNILSISGKLSIPNYIERQYFKALRPIQINDINHEFSTKLITDRFITLLGFTMHGRLLPKTSTHFNDYNNINDNIKKYTEIFDIHIWSNNCILIHHQKIILNNLNYNCDLNITLYKNVILSGGFNYEIKILWNEQSYGAEYPCSLYSTKVKGITFLDNCSDISYADSENDDDDDEDQPQRQHNLSHYNLRNNEGGLIKGIRYLNQI